MATTGSRTPQEVFQHHAEVLIAGDLEGIVSDYSDDAVFITPAGVLRGRDGVREGFARLLEDVPNAEWDVPTQIFEGEVLFIEWTAKAASSRSTTASIRSSFATARSCCRPCATRRSQRKPGGRGTLAPAYEAAPDEPCRRRSRLCTIAATSSGVPLTATGSRAGFASFLRGSAGAVRSRRLRAAGPAGNGALRARAARA
jgi:SnoaL-like protein